MSALKGFPLYAWLLAVPLMVGALVGISAGAAYIDMLLWNYGVVGAFGAPVLKFGHVWALNVLIGLNMLALRHSK